MLKIKKGIKKKIKGKKDKGKDEDDLFDPEQLEKLKRELAEKRKAAGETGDDSEAVASSSTAPPHEQDEEWLKFQALTAGVDNVLKKTSEELGKIKETSFYQRKSNDPTNLWKSEQDKERERLEAEAAAEAAAAAAAALAAEQSRIDQEEDPQDEAKGDTFIDPDTLPEPEELDDNLFDTSYLDAIASGEIQLAYIPESPTEEDGDDPFDTSGVADVVKRIEEAEKQAKRQVNLGAAVDFFSGRAGATVESRPRPKAGETGNKKARARPRAVNLLGDDDGGPVGPSESSNKTSFPPPKDILDEILTSSPLKELGSPLLDKVDLFAQSVVNVPSEPKEDVNSFHKELLGEFDLISAPSTEEIVEDPTFKKIPTTAILAALLEPEPQEDELDDEFAALAAESIHKGPSPLPPGKEEAEEEDPFDTTFVEKVAPPGKFELKLIESEVLGKSDLNDDDDFDFNPRVGEALAPGSVCPHPSPRSLLEDHSPSGEHPPALIPHVKGSAVTGELVETTPTAGLELDDPFDTSKVEQILPGKVELKFLEEELLKAVESHPKPKRPALPVILSAPVPPPPVVFDDDDDFDFDPRKDEPKPEPEKTQTDLLFEIHQDDDAFETKVLTPRLEEPEVEFDPFDTSIASAVILEPGQLELRLLESEFITSDPLPPGHVSLQFPVEDGLCDPEFDPRGGEEPDPFIVPVNHILKTEDIFDHHEEIQGKLLTPLQEASKSFPTVESLEADFDDPFDTSAIEVSKLLPQSELRQIEGELLSALSHPVATIDPLTLHQKVPTVPVDLPKPVSAPKELQPAAPAPPTSLFDVDDAFELELGHKPLTPAEVRSLSHAVDPFDTSIAEGIVPGKVEIKVLEEELGVGKVQVDPLSDLDFNPRGPQPIHPSALSFVSKTLEPERASDIATLSDDVDPFDTSLADNLGPTSVPSGPGKSELKALEAELL